jgi:cellulose biosynthesis protein BcsQ
MTAKVISVSNMKGGVGKTTIAVSLAREFAKRGAGAKVLIVDLDAQANASFWVCGDEALTSLIERGKTIDAFLEDRIVFEKKAALKDYVYALPASGERGAISVIPSSPELRLVEREMIVFLSRRRRNLLEVERVVSELFDEQMAELVSAYDYIVFDSAPGISALTEAALRSSDVIVVPTVPDFISNLGLEAFCKTVCWSQKKGEQERKRPWVVANMVKDSPHQQMMLREMRAEAETPEGGFNMFKIEIPSEPWIEEAASAGPTLPVRDNTLFARLAEEVLQAVAVQAPAR